MHRFAHELGNFATWYNLAFVVQAAGYTLALSMIGCGAGFVLGFLLAALRLTSAFALKPIRILATVYTEAFRRIPFLVTLFLVFFALQVAKIDVSVFCVAAISAAVIETAYLTEVVRAGFEAIPCAEWEAAAAMNFSLRQTLAYVVVPQAWKTILPPAFAFFLSFIKDSALASQIGVVELTFAGKVFNNRGFPPEIAFGSILGAYFLISYPLARLGRHMEKRLALSGNL